MERTDWQERLRQLKRTTKYALAYKLCRGAVTPDGRIVRNVGPVNAVYRWRKDEIIKDIMDIEHPGWRTAEQSRNG